MRRIYLLLFILSFFFAIAIGYRLGSGATGDTEATAKSISHAFDSLNREIARLQKRELMWKRVVIADGIKISDLNDQIAEREITLKKKAEIL